MGPHNTRGVSSASLATFARPDRRRLALTEAVSSNVLADLTRRFDAAMFDIYERAGHEVGYWAARYLQLLKRRGGLESARYLLRSKLTSDGYARLRDAGRLDLTVEALVLQPEFEPLFSPEELARAGDRLSRYRAMPLPAELDPSPELLALVQDAAAAAADARINHRDRIAAFGSPAIVAMQRWLEAGLSPGFAVAVIEAVGRTTDLPRALGASRGLRVKAADWRAVIDPAIARLESLRRKPAT